MDYQMASSPLSVFSASVSFGSSAVICIQLLLHIWPSDWRISRYTFDQGYVQLLGGIGNVLQRIVLCGCALSALILSRMNPDGKAHQVLLVLTVHGLVLENIRAAALTTHRVLFSAGWTFLHGVNLFAFVVEVSLASGLEGLRTPDIVLLLSLVSTAWTFSCSMVYIWRRRYRIDAILAPSVGCIATTLHAGQAGFALLGLSAPSEAQLSLHMVINIISFHPIYCCIYRLVRYRSRQAGAQHGSSTFDDPSAGMNAEALSTSGRRDSCSTIDDVLAIEYVQKRNASHSQPTIKLEPAICSPSPSNDSNTVWRSDRSIKPRTAKEEVLLTGRLALHWNDVFQEILFGDPHSSICAAMAEEFDEHIQKFWDCYMTGQGRAI